MRWASMEAPWARKLTVKVVDSGHSVPWNQQDLLTDWTGAWEKERNERQLQVSRPGPLEVWSAGKATGEAGMGGDSQELSFGHSFETLCLRCPSGEAK